MEVLNISNKELLINEEIREKQVRVVDFDSSQLGVLATKDALKIANDKNFDLVMISPTADPPVCRIMDYGKYKFEQAKKLKEAKKKQKIVEVKEIRLSLNIDENDLSTKTKHILRFLQDGDKVKVVIRFKGREMAHAKLGEVLLERVRESISEYGVVDKPPKFEGRSIVMIVSQKPTK